MSRSAAGGALRPGGALGPYPERTEPERSALERALASALGHQAARLRSRHALLQQRVARVAQEGAALTGHSDTELATLLPELRHRLRCEGPAEAPAARSFALVREVAHRTLGMRPYDAQVFGAWVMLDGMLAEMETGEGKTLTATLPACTAALAGIPVHVITANDYLAARDAKAMEPIYQALGLTVGSVTEDLVDPDARRTAYACDVTYTTNKQLAFDYLRDRVLRGHGRALLPLQLERLHAAEARIDRLLLRGLCFALVDEADSVLVDEARTPLILSRTVESKDEERATHQALALARGLRAGSDFTVSASERRVRLSAGGSERVETLARALGGVWSGRRRREELVRQALSALHVFHRDRDYLVRDDKVQIIDPHTGRVMADRSWERGLHQLVEAKEGCPLSGQRETLARISYQQLFRRYLRISGMTGTAREVAGELWKVYGLHVVRVPTARPLKRRRARDRVFAHGDARWRAVVARVAELRRSGRPVLVGTCSVESSEHLSRLLDEAGIPHQLLNARQDHREAEIVAGAGEPGRVTVATNMAGRGTDIGLGPGVAERGGLAVIATERSEARRIDRQLRGRCGRQGDPGSCESLLSLDDALPTLVYPEAVLSLLKRTAGGDGVLPSWLGSGLMSMPQLAVERRHRVMRADLLALDDQLGRALAFTGALE